MANSVKNSFMLVACLLTLLQLVVRCQATDKKQSGWDLCKHEDIKLRSHKDVYEASIDSCSPEVQEAIGDWVQKSYISGLNLHWFCQMHKVSNLISFYQKYLARTDGPVLPREFRRFTIAYGMQLASKCKSLLVEDFYKEAQIYLDKSDFEALEEWTGDKGPIARLLAPISKQAEFLLPSDFTTSVPEFAAKYKLAVKLTDSKKFVRAQRVCEKRFRPLYEPIVLPIALLARNGFNYNSPTLSYKLMMKQSIRNQNALWSRIVFFCESLKGVLLVEGPGAQPGLVDIDIKPNEEAAVSARADQHSSVVPTKLRQVYPYEPSLENWNPTQGIANFRLKTAVDLFNATRSEPERFMQKLLSNKWKLLRSAFKSDEKMVSLIRKALEIVTRQAGSKHDEELEATKKNLVSLLESKKRSKFFQFLSKVASGAKWVSRKLVRSLELVLVTFVVILVLTGQIIADKFERGWEKICEMYDL